MTDHKPASDGDIKSWRFHNDPSCDGMMTVGLPAMQTDKRGMLRLVARIAADAETIKAQAQEIERLRAALERSADNFCRFGAGNRCRPPMEEMCDACHARAALAASEGKESRNGNE